MLPVASAMRPTTRGPIKDEDYAKFGIRALAKGKKIKTRKRKRGRTLSVIENKPYLVIAKKALRNETGQLNSESNHSPSGFFSRWDQFGVKGSGITLERPVY